MSALLNIIGPIFGLVLAGFVYRRLGAPDAAAGLLNRFVAQLALPALLFSATSKIDWPELDHPGFLMAFGGGIAVTFAVALLLSRRVSLASASIQGLSATFANVGFMGIPLCLATFGEASVPPAVIATILTACLLFGFALALVEGGTQVDPSLMRVIRNVSRTLIRNPLLIAPALGLAVALSGVSVPVAVEHFAKLLGGAASPCALVAVGLFIGGTAVRFDGALVGRLVALKLVIQPAVTWVLAFHVFGMPLVWANTAVLMSAMPTGIGPFILANAYQRESASTSGSILLSTLLSVITVSVLVAFFAASAHAG